MKSLRIFVVASGFALAFVLQTGAKAQTPSPEALKAAQDFIAVVNSEPVADAVANMTAPVWPDLESALKAQNPKLDAAGLAELRREFERLMTENYTQVMKEAPAIYAKYFTAKEMQDLTAFYKTPLGAKAVKLMPKAMGEINTITLNRMQGLQQKVYLSFLTILQKRGLFAQ